MSLFKKKSGIKVTNINNVLRKQSAEVISIFDKKKAKEVKRSDFKSAKVVFFLEFNGDVMASSVKYLSKEIDTILMSAKQNDEVLVSITSPGGTVTGYGYASDQILRLKSAGLKVIAVVDQVAASGGYMMASVASEIHAANRAVVGSIGVVVGMPNYKELLEKLGISYIFYTAGIKKRGVTPFATPSDEQVEDLNEQLSKIHEQFKSHISEYRPQIDMDKCGTGEVWSGKEAMELGLIDAINISDDIIMDYVKSGKTVLKVKYVEPPKSGSFFSSQISTALEKVSDRLVERFTTHIQESIVKKW